MRRSHLLVVAAIALAALPACGSPAKKAEGGAAKVATLASTAPTPTPGAKASAKAERPRERLDTTSEKFEALLGPYNKCMAEHGVLSKQRIKAGQDGGARAATDEETQKSEAANRICEPQFFPLPPWEKDPANPESRDFARNVVKCLKNEGVKFVEVADDGISPAFGGDRNDPRSISMGLDLAPGCERKVAAEMK